MLEIVQVFFTVALTALIKFKKSTIAEIIILAFFSNYKRFLFRAWNRRILRGVVEQTN